MYHRVYSGPTLNICTQPPGRAGLCGRWNSAQRPREGPKGLPAWGAPEEEAKGRRSHLRNLLGETSHLLLVLESLAGFGCGCLVQLLGAVDGLGTPDRGLVTGLAEQVAEPNELHLELVGLQVGEGWDTEGEGGGVFIPARAREGYIERASARGMCAREPNLQARGLNTGGG